ncbi:MAG: pantetheine-phosphate adenylyltransferase [Flavobacteriales bacterium]|nr:pantetheine-phosphate adenylyltransferase [Flavobacteriales bacterium]
MTKIALFPGTFDPFTNGHLDIIEKGLSLFDHVIIAIGENANKKTMFPLEQRKQWIENCFIGQKNVEVRTYSGLTINFCKEIGATFILRGLRTVADFEYEKQIALVNSDQAPQIQTVFVLSEQKYTAVSSTVIRDLILHGGNYAKYLPAGVTVG